MTFEAFEPSEIDYRLKKALMIPTPYTNIHSAPPGEITNPVECEEYCLLFQVN